MIIKKLFWQLVTTGVMLAMSINHASAADENHGKWYDSHFIVCNTDINNWPDIQKKGEYRPESLITEKFIHCATPKQLAFVANKYFNGAHIVVWVINPELVNSPIKYEGKSQTDLYPHIYGPLNVNAIVATYEMKPKADGSYEVPVEFLPPVTAK